MKIPDYQATMLPLLRFAGDGEAALLFDQLQRSHREVFENDIRFRDRLGGQLGTIVNNGLNDALGSPGYLYAGLEAAERVLTEDPLITRYLTGEVHKSNAELETAAVRT